MNIIKSILMAGSVLTILCGSGGARAEDYYERLNKAVTDYDAWKDEKADIVIPSPDKAPAENTTDSIRGDGGAGALKNLKEERSLRIQQEILDQLPQ